jgi:hypothetical protein
MSHPGHFDRLVIFLHIEKNIIHQACQIIHFKIFKCQLPKIDNQNMQRFINDDKEQQLYVSIYQVLEDKTN